MGLNAEHRRVVRGPAAEPATAAAGVAAPRARIAIAGAGPAGLFAAERLANAGYAVTVYDRMPSPARKFLMAGRGGLNLTHSEDLGRFLARYHDPGKVIAQAVEAFPPADLIAWADSLGAETFAGSSGRVFPNAMKASPLLRAWLRRLDALGVVLKTEWRWTGFGDRATRLRFETPAGEEAIDADAVLLALGGASWPRLGSDGSWLPVLESAGVTVAPLVPSNCGVRIAWSAHVLRFHGTPLKRIAITCNGERIRGEAVITMHGLEGGAIYGLSGPIRDALAAGNTIAISIDLRPDVSHDDLAARLSKAKVKDSLANLLRKAAGLPPAAIALLRENGPLTREAYQLAARIKAASLHVTGLSGMERAISSAGGITCESIDGGLMLKTHPGVFVAGEMLDFDAPTGGYLLQAAFSSAAAAAHAMERYIERTGCVQGNGGGDGIFDAVSGPS